MHFEGIVQVQVGLLLHVSYVDTPVVAKNSWAFGAICSPCAHPLPRHMSCKACVLQLPHAIVGDTLLEHWDAQNIVLVTTDTQQTIVFRLQYCPVAIPCDRVASDNYTITTNCNFIV